MNQLPNTPERRAIARAVPLAVSILGILGTVALVGALNLVGPPARVPQAVILVERPAPALPVDVLSHGDGLQLLARRGPPTETGDDPRCGAGWRRLSWNQPPLSVCVSDAGRVRILSTSITPITSEVAANSGFTYGGDSWNVLCTIVGEATLYPAVHRETGNWKVFQGFPCTISSAVVGQGSCSFPAPLQGSGLTWNVFKTGAGTVTGCTAEGRSGQVPPPPISPAGGGDGTVTDITCGTGLTCTPNPITTSGTIAPTFGTAAGQVAQGGVVSAATCAYPASMTYNAAGQVTACTAGSAPGQGWTYIPMGVAVTIGISNPDLFYFPATEGAASIAITNDQWFWLVPANGTITDFTTVNTNIGMGGNLVCAVKKASEPTMSATLSNPATPISVTITDGSNQAQNTSATSSAVIAGEYYTVQCTPGSGATVSGKMRVYFYYQPSGSL